MTILFFTRRFYPLIGGVEKHVLEVGKRLIKRGYKVVVIAERDKNLSLRERIEGIEIIRINAGSDDWFKKFRIWIELFKNLSLIKSADIIHCHDVFFWYLPFRFLYPFKKVYTTFHGYEGNNIPTKRAIFMHKIVEKLSYGNICVGDFLKKWYGTTPTFVTYGGVDEELLNQENIQPTEDIMFLGRLEEETGIMKYLKALKLLKDAGKDLSLDVFGDGSLMNKAKQFSKQNNLHVKFKGLFKNPGKYITDYKYVFVSRYLGILEALAVKRPVFAEYNNLIKKDYLEMTPFSKFITVFEDSKELLYILKNNKLNTPNKGYEWVKNQTWDNVVAIYLILWKIK